jgi:hypothetical protein
MQIKQLRSSGGIEVVEIDECLHLSEQINYCWICIAIDRNVKRFINFVIGTRGIETGLNCHEIYLALGMSTSYFRDLSPIFIYIQCKNYLNLTKVINIIALSNSTT